MRREMTTRPSLTSAQWTLMRPSPVLIASEKTRERFVHPPSSSAGESRAPYVQNCSSASGLLDALFYVTARDHEPREDQVMHVTTVCHDDGGLFGGGPVYEMKPGRYVGLG